MSFDTNNRYTGTGRDYHDLGETTPEIEVSESVRPWGKFLPAPYLPISRFDVHKRASVVLSVGTPVAFDKLGSLIPAGIPDGHVFEYDADDYRTGSVATLRADTGAAVAAGVTETAMHADLLDTGFARPAGVTSYNVYSHEGGTTFTSWPTYSLNHDNPATYGLHNTMSQDLVAITCDYCMLVPYVEGKNLSGPTVKVFDNTANEVSALTKKAKSYVFAHDELVTSGVNGVLLTSGLSCVYVSPTVGTDDDGIATADGGLYGTAGAATFLAPGDAVGSAVNCTPVGYHVVASSDSSKYIVLKSEHDLSDNTGLDIYTGTGVLTSGAWNYMLEGALTAGDRVVARAGKYVKYVSARHQADEVCGQILAVDSNVTDKSYLSRVKSAYERATDPGDMMPGSATRGIPFQLHMVTDGAWRQYSMKKTLTGTTISETGLGTPALRLVTINFLR